MGKKVYVDLTHPFSAEIPRWPYFDKPEITNAHMVNANQVLGTQFHEVSSHAVRPPAHRGAQGRYMLCLLLMLRRGLKLRLWLMSIWL